MTAPNSVDPARFLHDQLASASLDLLRSMLTTFVNTLMMSGVYLVALVSFPWVGSRPLRSLRGRPSQVKGAFGVATLCRFAAPWTCEPPRPLRAGATGRPGPALHHAQHPRAHNGPAQMPHTALFPQVTLLDRPARMIMKPYPRKRQ